MTDLAGTDTSNIEYTHADFDVVDIKSRAKDDMTFLGGLCLPDVCTASFPDWYIYIWSLITAALIKTRDFSKFALALPRSHAKTTVVKILVIFIVLFTRRRFILLVGASAGLAENILRDICDILDSPNIIGVFGNWRDDLETDRTDLKIFTFLGRPVILRAIGTGGTLRGINVKNSRPDVIICDDMQTKEDAESETSSKKLLSWFVGTLMKAKAGTGCTFLYVGNMYRDIKMGGSTGTLYTCILRNLQKNSSWTSLVVGGILASGKALWEEVRSLAELLEELKNDTEMGQSEVFFSEVLNDPTCGSGQYFDLSKMPVYNIDPLVDLKLGSFIMIDPSMGKKKSDAQIVGEFEVYSNTIKDESLPVDVLVEAHIKQTTAPKLVDYVIDLAIKKKIPLVCAESVAYQGTLLQWFEKTMQIRREAGEALPDIKFLPITPGGRSKPSRIINWFKRLMIGTSRVHPNSLSLVLSQIQTFDPMSNANVDDIIDTGAYGEDVLLNYPTELMSKEVFSLEERDYSVVEENCVF